MSRPRLVPGEDLGEALNALAQAPDFATAAEHLLDLLAEAAGSRGALFFALDREARELTLVHSAGLVTVDAARRSIPVEDEGNPLVIAAMALQPVACDGDSARRIGLPFELCVALPLPQPPFRGGPVRRTATMTFDRPYAGCQVLSADAYDAHRRAGYAPFGVVVLEGAPLPATASRVAAAAVLSGPIVARMFSTDDLRRSAERLDEQRALLTAIINALPDPIVITDETSNTLVQNSRAENLLSPRGEDSEGRRRAVEINNLLFSSFLSKSAVSGARVSSARELNLVDPNEGTDLLFEVLSHPLSPPVASEPSVLTVLRDVTDLKRAAIELERQFGRVRVTETEASRERDRLNMILNNVGDPILVTDDQSKIVLMNPQAERLFELPVGAQGDRAWEQRVRGNDTKLTTLVANFAISSSLYRREQITLGNPRGGVEFPAEVVSGKILNERGEPLGIVSVVHDLTKHAENERLYLELKKFSAELEDRIRLATSDLEAQNLKLQWQSSELEKAYRLKSEFLANMSHELRTPINALIGYTALMLDRIYGDLTSKQEEGLQRIQVSSQHLLALINDILDLAKIEAGKMPVHLEAASLEATVSEVAAQIEPLVRRKSLEFRFEIAADLPAMLTDRTKVKQIVLNLLSNAVKFTHKGHVALTATATGGTVRIVVSDTGIGIQPEHLDVIFEEFRQVDQSRTREYGGTGLGLSITRKLVALLGGSITVKSEYGEGTTFVVALPLRSEALTSDEQLSRAVIGAMRGPS
ncbi:MAG: ATP-binding protein [Gemmatimonadaceae bacterium]